MRDPNRIDGVLAAVGEVWEKCPDMRLGQLLSNVYTDPTLYFIEDDKLVEGLTKYYDEIENGVDILRRLRENEQEYEIGTLIQNMRPATETEMQSVNDYIDSVAVPTGRTIWDFYEDE